MITAIAFVGGFLVCMISLVAPHSRSSKSSIDEFVNFQQTLRSLSTTDIQNHQHPKK